MAGGLSISPPVRQSVTLAPSPANGLTLMSNGTINQWNNANAVQFTNGPFYLEDFLNSGTSNTYASSNITQTTQAASANTGVIELSANSAAANIKFWDGTHDNWIPGTNTISFYWRFYPTSTVNTYQMQVIDSGGTNTVYLLLQGSTTTIQSSVGGVSKMNTTITTPTANTWHTFRLDISNSVITAYIDGAQVATDSTAGDIPTVAMHPVMASNTNPIFLDYFLVTGTARG